MLRCSKDLAHCTLCCCACGKELSPAADVAHQHLPYPANAETCCSASPWSSEVEKLFTLFTHGLAIWGSQCELWSNEAPCVVTKLLACSCTKIDKNCLQQPASSCPGNAPAVGSEAACCHHCAVASLLWPECGGRHAGLVLRSSLKRSPAAPAHIVTHFKQYLQQLTVSVNGCYNNTAGCYCATCW